MPHDNDRNRRIRAEAIRYLREHGDRPAPALQTVIDAHPAPLDHPVADAEALDVTEPGPSRGPGSGVLQRYGACDD